MSLQELIDWGTHFDKKEGGLHLNQRRRTL